MDDETAGTPRLPRALLAIPFVMETVPFLFPIVTQVWLRDTATFLAYQLLCLLITSGILTLLVYPQPLIWLGGRLRPQRPQRPAVRNAVRRGQK